MKVIEGIKGYKFPIESFFRLLIDLEKNGSKFCVLDGFSVSLRFDDFQVDFSPESCTALEIWPKPNL